MEPEKLIRTTTLLLCFVAGFCDTLTFVAAGEVFSAHVTGNFIVFAYDIIKHGDTQGWQKLLTFPVFIFSVMLGGYLGRRSANIYLLLILQGGLLLLSGVLALLFLPHRAATGWPVQLITMVIVIAMAFQNTFGKLYNKATYGLTTVMTGNVTQASLDLIKGMGSVPKDPEAWISFKKQLIMISGFLFGCVGGAVFAQRYGLTAAFLPAILLLIWLGSNKMFNKKTD